MDREKSPRFSWGEEHAGVWEIFEEACGIAKYRYRKTEAERKLAQTQENLLRLKDIMTELEERVGPLKVQSEKAKRFLELAEQRKQIELSLWTAQLAKMTVQLRELDDKQTVGRLEQSRIEEKLQQLTGQMEEFFSSMQKAGVQMADRTEIGQMEEVLARSDSRLRYCITIFPIMNDRFRHWPKSRNPCWDSQESFARYIAQKEAEKTVLLGKNRSRQTQNQELNREMSSIKNSFADERASSRRKRKKKQRN